MAAAYHMEALRKQRLIDRKQEAVTRTECLIRSEHEQVRSERRSMRAADKESSNLPEKENDHLTFRHVTSPVWIYSRHRHSNNVPEDQIYAVLQPPEKIPARLDDATTYKQRPRHVKV